MTQTFNTPFDVERIGEYVRIRFDGGSGYDEYLAINSVSFRIKDTEIISIVKNSEVIFDINYTLCTNITEASAEDFIRSIIRLLVTNVDTKLNNTQFGELKVANRTNLINLKSSFGISPLRDLTTTSNGGTVVNSLSSPGEYAISTSTNVASFSSLVSRERGRYTAGIEFEVGLGVRLGDTNYVGNEYARWGYYDSRNGYYYQYDSNGLRCFIRRGGIDTEVAETNDINELVSGVNLTSLNLLEGNIYNISVVWYGYGDINFYININNILYDYSRFFPSDGVSTETAVLPLSVELNNNGSGNAHTIYVAGRQFSCLGSYVPVRRLTPVTIMSKTVPTVNAGSTDNFTPIFSLRSRTTDIVSQVKFFDIQVISTSNILLAVFLDTALVGASYENIPNVNTSDTLLEYDVSATDMTANNLLVYSSLAIGSGNPTPASLTSPLPPNVFDLPGVQDITICAKALTTTATVFLNILFQEEF